MSKVTDRGPGMPEGITGEHMSKAVRVLAELAGRYAEGDPGAPVDWMEWLARVGAVAFEVAGPSEAGAARLIASVVRDFGPNPDGATRGEFAVGLLEVARAAGWSEEDNEPVIPRFPHPRQPSDPSSKEAVQRALRSIAARLLQERPDELMTEAAAWELADDEAQGEPVLCGGVLAMLPRIDEGVTRGEFGAQLVEAVDR